MTHADIALIQRTIATLRAADLMADAIPALADLHKRLAETVPPQQVAGHDARD